MSDRRLLSAVLPHTEEWFMGFECGVLYTLMSGQWTSISGEYFKENQEQLFILAKTFGYTYEWHPVNGERAAITFVLKPKQQEEPDEN